MATEDPFFVVKDEVQKTIVTSDALFHRWCELSEDRVNMSREEYDWTTNELRNCLRSIEWDLEDLEETISIVEKNPKKFKLDAAELNARRLFISQTRSAVQGVRERMTSPSSRKKVLDIHPTVPTASNGPDKPQNKYSRLQNEPDIIVDRAVVSNQNHIQQTTDQLGGISPAATLTPNDNSPQPCNEQDEQSIMLGGDIQEMSTSETRVRGALRRAVRVLHIGRDWKQWTAITILLLVVAIVISLFFIL